jgi:hypothetical protein
MDTTPVRPLPKLKILPPQLQHPASPAVDEDDIQLTSPPAIPEEELQYEVDNYMVLNGFRDRADSKTGTSSEGEPEIEDTGSGRKRKWLNGGLEDSGEDDDQKEDEETPGEDEDSEGSDEEETDNDNEGTNNANTNDKERDSTRPSPTNHCS